MPTLAKGAAANARFFSDAHQVTRARLERRAEDDPPRRLHHHGHQANWAASRLRRSPLRAARLLQPYWTGQPRGGSWIFRSLSTERTPGTFTRSFMRVASMRPLTRPRRGIRVTRERPIRSHKTLTSSSFA